MEPSPYLWTFPVYVLAANITLSEDGQIILDEDIRFASPEMEPGRPDLAVFTDVEWAENFRQSLQARDTLSALELGPESLLVLLRRALSNYPYIVVNLDRQTKIGATMKTENVIAGLEGFLAGQARPSDPTDQ